MWQLQIYHGDALLKMKEWKRAEAVYRDALQSRKHFVKVESGDQCEMDAKIKLHTCYVSMGQINQAINILQSISSKNRTAKINMALGRLYHQNGMDKVSTIIIIIHFK